MAKRRAAKSAVATENEDDAGAFRAAVRDVTPLAPVSTEHLAKPRVRKRPARAASLAPLDLESADPAAAQASAAAEPVTAEAALSFHRPGLRPQAMRRLRRGLYPIEDELDLHGRTESAARDSLLMFLARSRDLGLRCVRIIHGKGYRSGTRGPVLKAAVNTWLRRHMDVAAFTSARAIDGGAGALYVLLRQ